MLYRVKTKPHNPDTSMKIKNLLFASIATIALGAQASHAIVMGGAVTVGSGSFIELTPPLAGSNPVNTVGNNTFQNPNLYAFNEDQNVAVGVGGLTPDIGAFLAEGTIVASHYVFFDPNASARQEGYVLFDAAILAIFTSTASLSASDYLANTGVTYLNPGLRGLESGDSATINGSNDKRLDVDWRASTPGDYVRVLTARSPGAPVPDSGATAALFGLGIVALGCVRRWKR